MSSISTSSDDERLEKPVVERKSVGVQIQEPPVDAHYTRHNVVDYALFLCRGRKNRRRISNSDDGRDHDKSNTRLVVLDESTTLDFHEDVRTLSARTPAEGGPHVRLVLMNRDEGTFLEDKSETLDMLQQYWSIDMDDVSLLTSHLVSSYHSRIVRVDGDICLDISYNIREDILYLDQNNISSLESTLSVNVIKPTDLRVQHEYESLYFRHNLTTGQTTYILPNASREYRSLLDSVGRKFSERVSSMHPFSLHAVILFQSLAARSVQIDDLYRRLLWIETQIYQGSIFQGTNSEKFIRYIQLSHKLSRTLITLEHRNERDRSHIEKLLDDHKRLRRLIKQSSPRPQDHIDMNMHEHVRDSLLSLKDLAHDQDRQIVNSQRKTQLFITLLYNLITGHDSGINLRIASETAKVAHEAKKDSTSMKIIAGVTMFYLPATFVCSLFGTNFVALNTNTSEPTFIVSKLWWVYIAFAVPLTAATIMGFHIWRRWRREQVILDDKYEV
ncbi:hypothetical protein EYB25_001793 [Talaromyces marneffei]|uniref:CorA family metal ion transporter n=2 Tax=Talaromyces marneffei TaxID=37727 RepID=B6Q475_TALMQ|nr:uncharacterized protein EYB26_000541 [Talaromyces marneffei]EEA27200.1 hypothetical protein PMAA_020900 [Talaromyces marneffei ATCC 18224]KAE8557087.1 hypothetical protein EYB25_001793 [Talaromyces marneffei]QGA12896.1 hypothetical protein EYB26_000541 [Talaromyces marneffei]